MASSARLMGLGMSPFLARKVGFGALARSPSGASRASAQTLIGHNAAFYVTSSNAGSGFLLPTLGGEVANGSGAEEGDQLQVFNLLTASIVVYGPTGTSFTGDGASTDGSVGISVATHRSAVFVPLSLTTWGVIKASA